MAMKNSQHMGFWLGIVLVGFLLSPLIRTGESMERFVRSEIDQTRSALGVTATGYVVDFANFFFEGTPLGMIAATGKAVALSDADVALSRQAAGIGGVAMANFFNSYITGIVQQAYVAAMRLAIAMAWIIILGPFLFASAYDGFMQRRIKRSEFGAIRPATFTVAGIFVIPLLFVPLVYLVLPFSLSPLLAPVWALIVSIPLSILVSNMQPLFGR